MPRRAQTTSEVEADRERFAARLRAARIAAGYPSNKAAGRAFAQATGLTDQVYRQYEHGQGVPGFFRLVEMVQVLRLDPKILAPELFAVRPRRRPRPRNPGVAIGLPAPVEQPAEPA